MTSKKQTEIAKRRQQVASRYLAGETQWEIAEALGVNQSTVSRDLTHLHGVWQEAGVRDLDEAKGVELAKIDALEREYWQAWRRSCAVRESTTRKVARGGRDGGKAEVITKKDGMVGDPRFLQGVMSCIERRCKLLGIDAPIKMRHGGPDDGPIPVAGSLNLGALSTEELELLLTITEKINGADGQPDDPE